jgi:hypothetical protein
VTGPQAPVVEADGGVEAGGGKAGELVGDLADPGPAQVAQGDADHLVRAQPSEQLVEAGHVVRVEPRHRPGEEPAQVGLGAGAAEEARASGLPECG